MFIDSWKGEKVATSIVEGNTHDNVSISLIIFLFSSVNVKVSIVNLSYAYINVLRYAGPQNN